MAGEDKEVRAPHPVDVHVGGRIRARRKDLNLSQECLAEELALTFQQVQKYERGVNRVSASKLYDMAGVLEVSISFFFEGLPDPIAARARARPTRTPEPGAHLEPTLRRSQAG